MPRVLKENPLSWGSLAGGTSLVAVVSFSVLLQGAAMPSHATLLMVVTLMWHFFILCQCILGPMRRYSRHWFVQYGARAVFDLPFPLVVYAANTVRSSSSDTNLLEWCLYLFVWSLFVTPFFGMSTYTLGNSLIGGSHFLKSSFYLFLILQTSDVKRRAEKNEERNELVLIVGTLLLAVVSPMMLSLPSLMTSYNSSRMVCTSKEFADYMKQEAKSPSPFFCNTGDILEGCKYPIIKLKDGQWINISDLLRYGDPDILLSYSFFRLLTRRYFELDCAEEGKTVVRDFVLKELVLDESYNYKRAFTIVEKQLAFLHDYLFTINMSTVLIPPRFMLAGIPFGPTKLVLQLPKLLLWIDVSVPICLAARKQSHITLAVVLFLGPMLIWWFHSERCFATDGYTIWVALRGHYTGRICNDIPSRHASWLRQPYWQNEIGQYSLLEDYDRHLTKTGLFLVFCKVIFSSEWPPSFIKHLPKEEDAVRLEDSVRELVAFTLRDLNGPPTNGTRSLLRNRHQYRTMDDLSWTCTEDTYMHTILIWHIATCYCSMSPPENLRLEQTRASYEVATKLSKYCAYLVAFLPEFLPGSKLTAQMVLQDVLQQAKKLSMVETRTTWEQLLQKVKGRPRLRRMSMEEKRTKMREMELPEQETMTTFEKGVKLGRQLEQLDASQRWEVMAEFWAEAILYIAPSDNAAAHCEHLAKGGEFITHLWALLSNAGILKRANDETQQPEPVVPANE
ncbi:hypothetical protein ACP4OV_011660 [Aristida adscensionis]